MLPAILGGTGTPNDEYRKPRITGFRDAAGGTDPVRRALALVYSGFSSTLDEPSKPPAVRR
jgi:hypothetical protein